eukprot:3047275-Amphidinium_carterae.1
MQCLDGSWASFRVHKDWMEHNPAVGRCYDLAHAYKQLALSPSACKYAGGAVWSTDHKEVRFFVQQCLPFGARASVA